MDVFVPSSYTTLPAEQSPLANRLNPGSLQHSWRVAKPVHGLQRRHQTNLGQISARQARMDKYPPIATRDMFPFRVFVPPPQFQSQPNWTDSYGPANWRTFSVWTGCATSWWQVYGFTPGYGLVAYPTFVARTCGYNNALPLSAEYPQNTPFYAENYNEIYSAIQLGNYSPHSGSWTPANQEIFFTARPSSFAAIWIQFDVVTGDQCPTFLYAASGYGVMPTLHFGGLDSNGDYYGDANASNFSVTPGMPPQITIAPVGTSDIPEGSVLVASMQIGQYGNYIDTGNDGLTQIYQILNANINPVSPNTIQSRGPWDTNTIYFPNDIVTFTVFRMTS